MIFFATLDDPESDYCPAFTYPKLEEHLPELDKRETALRDLKKRVVAEENNELVRNLYCYKINIELALIGLARKIDEGNDRHTDMYMKFMYGDVSDSLHEYAERRRQEMMTEAKKRKEKPESEEFVDLDEKIYTPEDIKRYFDIALEELSFSETWRTKLTDEARSITVRAKYKEGPTILIPEQRAKVSVVKLLQLISHEIESHVQTDMNGRFSNLNILTGKIRSDRSEDAQEGLAIERENMVAREIFGDAVEPRKALPWYPLAIRRARRGGNFRDTFLYIRDLRKEYEIARGKPEDEAEENARKGAWKTCRRVFRGMTDLSRREGYCFAKDKSYLGGEVDVKQMKASGKLGYLEIGKVNIRSLPELLASGIGPEGVKYPYQDVAKKIWEKHLRERHTKKE